MPLTTGKHNTQEIDGVYCTLVESGISAERCSFLKEVLEFNGFEVKTAEVAGKEEEASTFTIGVTDLVFNPVIAVYEQSLKRPGGGIVSPVYWDQQEEIDSIPYFDYREKNPDAENLDDFQVNPWSYRTL